MGDSVCDACGEEFDLYIDGDYCEKCRKKFCEDCLFDHDPCYYNDDDDFEDDGDYIPILEQIREEDEKNGRWKE